jgi:hypothetical protein
MLTPENLKTAFLLAISYSVTPRLLKYTAAICADRITARIVVLDTIDDSELDDVYDILGNVMCHFSGTAQFDLVLVSSAFEASADAELPIVLYRADLSDARAC